MYGIPEYAHDLLSQQDGIFLAVLWVASAVLVICAVYVAPAIWRWLRRFDWPWIGIAGAVVWALVACVREVVR